MPSPNIRFGLQASPDRGPGAWRDLAQRAEAAGFETLFVADHPGTTAAPAAALAAAGAVTSTLRLGTYVANAGVRDPLALARDAASVDVLSGGRFTLGLGAGHTPAEWTMAGLPYPSPTERAGRLEETVDVVTRLLAGEVVTHHGAYLDLDGAELLAPRPVQEPIPLLVGGNGARVLRLGARRAAIVSLSGAGRTLADGHSHEVDWSAAAITERVGIVRDASPPAGPPVIDALVQWMEITTDRRAVAETVARHAAGANAADVLLAPYVLVGTAAQLVDEIHGHYERWGFSSYVVRAPAIDAAATIIDRLRTA